MKTSFKLLLPAALLLLSGCAEMVKKEYKPVRGGTVRYSTGWFLADKNREKAVEEMKAYCAPGQANLMAENAQKEFTGYSHSNTDIYNNSMSTSTTQSQENYIYLHFRCVKAKIVRR